MTEIYAVDPVQNPQNKTVYNALKIQVNSPQTNIPEGVINGLGNGEYNAVSIEVNEPRVNVQKSSIYDYPEAEEIVTFDKAALMPVNMPEMSQIPMAYQTNLINHKTFINAEFEVRPKNSIIKDKQQDNLPPVEVVEVPEPNFTTVEAEKKTDKTEKLAFHGLNFKGSSEVAVAEAKIKPSIDIEAVVDNLKSADYDVQAKQLESIAKTLSDNKGENASNYLTTRVFSALIDIVETDTTDLTGPSEEQTESRKKIVINKLAVMQALDENPNLNPEDVKLPYEISENETKIANTLSQKELAERNKEMGTYILAGLIKAYVDESEKKLGEVVPLTDLPGLSSIVNILRKSDSADLKFAAINSLMLIQRSEYAKEIEKILMITANDPNYEVAQYAAMALMALKNGSDKLPESPQA